MTRTLHARRALTVVVGLVVALVVSALGALPAEAAPAAPGGLSPSGSISDHTPMLAWNRVSGAARYEVQVSTAPDGSGNVYSRVTTNSRASVTNPLPTGLLYWRVRGISSTGETGAWGQTSLTLSAMAGPTPLAPADGGPALSQPDSPPVLRWTDVPGAWQYTIEVDTEPDFIGATTYRTSTTSKVVPDAKAGGTYYWRVQAQIAFTNDNTQWSPTWSYSIDGLKTVEQSTISPTDDANAGLTDVALDWDPVPGAKEYQLQVDNSVDFASPVDNITVQSTRYSPPVTYRNDQYYWRVRAVNLNGEVTDWKAISTPQFKRWWPEKAVLQFPPSSGTTPVGDDFFYQWSPVAHASYYQLEMGTDPNFSPGTYQTCRTDQTTYTPGSPIGDACMPSQGVTYYWRVLPYDAPANIPGIYSDIHTFIYDSGRVMQVSPAPGATVGVPALSWQASQDAERYHVEVKNSGGGIVSAIDTYALSWTPTGVLDPNQSPFTWTVQAIDSDGHMSPKYPGRTFTLSGSPATTGVTALTPLSPDPTAGSQRFPALTWEPMTGAAYYRVRMAAHGSPYMYPDSESPLLGTNVAYPSATDWGSRFLTPGTYDWWVDAYNAQGGYLGTGSTSTLQILDLDKAGNLQVALTGMALNRGEGCKATLSDTSGAATSCEGTPSTPVLDWDPVPQAAFYMVYVSRDKAFTNLIYNGVNTRTTNSRWTPSQAYGPSSMPDNNSGDAYYWLIRPCKSPTNCAPDPLSTPNPADNSFSKQSPQVELTSPAVDAVKADDVRFDWTDYRTTNDATTWLANMTDKSQQSGQRYRIQISQNDSFSGANGSYLGTWEVDQTTFTPWNDTLPEGKLYWRVQAIDNANNYLRWSNPRSFTKASPRPLLTAPSQGTTVSSTPVFRWDPLNFAGAYQIEVYKNNDTAFSDSNRVISATVTQTAFSSDRPLPPSPTAYVWRVRRLDHNNRPGAWSSDADSTGTYQPQLGRFYVSSKATTLGYPAPGGYVNHADVYFTWSPVDGAKRYRFERRVAGSTGIVESQDTSGTSWTSEDVPDGSYEWRVTAFDAVDNVLGVTDWRSFKVDATRPTVTSRSPATSASRTSNFVARFSEPVSGVSGTTMRIYKKGSSTALSARVTIDSTRRVATLNPSSNLRSGATYYIRFTASRIKDGVGNTLVAPSWTVRVR